MSNANKSESDSIEPVMPDHWHRTLVRSIIDESGCSFIEATNALGKVCEVVQRIHMSAYKSGFNDGVEFKA